MIMMHACERTVTLDPDVAAKLQQVTRERGISFKTALNEAVRSGLARHGAGPSLPDPRTPDGSQSGS